MKKESLVQARDTARASLREAEQHAQAETNAAAAAIRVHKARAWLRETSQSCAYRAAYAARDEGANKMQLDMHE